MISQPTRSSLIKRSVYDVRILKSILLLCDEGVGCEIILLLKNQELVILRHPRSWSSLTKMRSRRRHPRNSSSLTKMPQNSGPEGTFPTTRAHTHTHTHTYVHTDTHTHAHTHAHTQTHTYTQSI